MNRWDDRNIPSMYDKTLLGLETNEIRLRIPEGRLLDAGCGEGEGTLEYSRLAGVTVDAIDGSPVRLEMARERLKDRPNVSLKQKDVRDLDFVSAYNCVVSQRLLINMVDWEEQKRVLDNFHRALVPGGKLIMAEGSIQGMQALNYFRGCLGLPPIPEASHNVYMDDRDLIGYLEGKKMARTYEGGLGVYTLMTRGIQPYFVNRFDWASDFNQKAASMVGMIDGANRFSRIKVWVFVKL